MKRKIDKTGNRSVFFMILSLSILLLVTANVNASYCIERLEQQQCIVMSTIKYPLNITFSYCSVDDECIVHVLGANKNIKNASVVISGVINIQGFTNDEGKFKFSPDKAGNIKIKAEKDEYYKAEGNFSIKTATVSIEIPDNIKAHKEIDIKIKNLYGKGVKTDILITTPNRSVFSANTDKYGNAKFTPEILGKYEVKVDDGNYKGEREFVVYGKLNIICPNEVKFMNKFTVRAVDESNNVIDVKIKILELNKEINSGEEVVASKCGELNLVAEKEYYEKAINKILVKNKKLNLTGKNKLNAKEAYVFSLKDEDGNPVEGVKILINGSFVGTTTGDGNITIKIESVGNYIISAKKNCYDDASLSVEVTEFPWWLLWLLLLLILLLLFFLLWKMYKYKSEQERVGIPIATPFGTITESTKIVKRSELNIPGASQEQKVYIYLIAEKNLKNCAIVDNIPTKYDVNVMTLDVERRENNLILNLGDIAKGEVRILNYIINGACEVENAKVVYNGGEISIPVKYV